MESILEKLYYGEISPCSRPTPTTERCLKSKEKVGQYEEAILAKYPDCKELLESYADAIHITAAPLAGLGVLALSASAAAAAFTAKKRKNK